jgi:hypothetical protein
MNNIIISRNIYNFGLIVIPGFQYSSNEATLGNQGSMRVGKVSSIFPMKPLSTIKDLPHYLLSSDIGRERINPNQTNLPKSPRDNLTYPWLKMILQPYPILQGHQ